VQAVQEEAVGASETPAAASRRWRTMADSVACFARLELLSPR